MSIYKRYASNVIIESIGAANTVTFQNTAGSADVIITGNLTVTGNASLSGNISGDKLFNGTTSIEIQTSSGNANITVGGTSNVAVYATTGEYITGLISATGNIIGGNLNTAGQVSAAGNVNGGNLTITTGNIVLNQASNVGTAQMIQFRDSNAAITTLGQNIGAIEWYSSDSTGLGPRTTAALKAVYSDANGNANILLQTNSTTRLTVLGTTGNVGIANTAPLHTFAVTGTGYYSGNVTIAGVTAVTGNVSAAGNVIGANLIISGGTFITGAESVTGNITGGNIITVGAISAGNDGILATGNIRGGNVNSDGNVSVTGTVVTDKIVAQGNITGNLIAVTSNVSGNMFGTGIGVENIVWQSTSNVVVPSSLSNIGVLTFNTLAGYSYKFESTLYVIPDGASNPTNYSVYFDGGSCTYTVEQQSTSTAAFTTSTSNVSDALSTNVSTSGTTPRTVRITGTFYHSGTANVSLKCATAASNLTVLSGSSLTYTRIG